MQTPGYIANFDSAAAMLRATARYLRQQPFPVVGMMPRHMLPVVKAYGTAVNALPRVLREYVYTWSGWGEAISAKKTGQVSAEQLSQWAVSEYPESRYPGVMLGSSNGANVHLCSALGIPWLPQTFMIPVARHGVHPDEPQEDVEWALGPARDLLDANPEVALHHMHDPNQDRLMVQHMAYFRIKRRTLGRAYRQFLLDRLEPGGTIFLVETTLRWPTTRVQERHYFQFGALGGADVEEFLHGGPRVEEYLKRYRSHRTHWEPPEPDAERAEAEWGFDEALREDVLNFARKHGYRIRRIVVEQPQDFSPFVADLYREWNRDRGVLGNRLLVGSFILIEPYLSVVTGSAPYWMVFNKLPSLHALEEYLDDRPAFDDIYLTLFSHGVESIGLAEIDQWREALHRARRRGEFVGVDESLYPRDFAVMARYHDALAEAVPSRYPLPTPLRLEELDHFIEAGRDRYEVQWLEADETAELPLRRTDAEHLRGRATLTSTAANRKDHSG